MGVLFLFAECDRRKDLEQKDRMINRQDWMINSQDSVINNRDSVIKSRDFEISLYRQELGLDSDPFARKGK